ncbi:hypothetical protein JSY36_00285 [Bacillus sp. H-16]|uniref:MotE family protein n=1 Tax=Alteribacter salitolerans TaxID=2912333 RepID=UPI00196480C7|nr:hypothetical protein [Alteribacter salitolerans]MBM7094175.1 hypothetical protein [Alteribacter salitolerans]
METKERTNKLQAVFMLILIPVIFIVIFGFVILSILHDDMKGAVLESAGSWPVVGSLIETEEEIARDALEDRIAELERENASYSNAVGSLENEIADLERIISEMEEQGPDNDPVEADEEEITGSDLEEIVRTLENMTASKAAAILANTDESDAVLYLNLMRTSNRSQILQRMDPEKAAVLMSLMKN